MGNELTLPVSISTPTDVIATLINSATAIRNTNSITRVKYAEIQAMLKICGETLETHRADFASKIQVQKGILDALYANLELMQDKMEHSSGEQADRYCSLATEVLQIIGVIGGSGPEMIAPLWKF